MWTFIRRAWLNLTELKQWMNDSWTNVCANLDLINSDSRYFKVLQAWCFYSESQRSILKLLLFPPNHLYFAILSYLLTYVYYSCGKIIKPNTWSSNPCSYFVNPCTLLISTFFVRFLVFFFVPDAPWQVSQNVPSMNKSLKCQHTCRLISLTCLQGSAGLFPVLLQELTGLILNLFLPHSPRQPVRRGLCENGSVHRSAPRLV